MGFLLVSSSLCPLQQHVANTHLNHIDNKRAKPEQAKLKRSEGSDGRKIVDGIQVIDNSCYGGSIYTLPGSSGSSR